ncbi:hypothetical protein Hte_007405 [Hypoxylon texense]
MQNPFRAVCQPRPLHNDQVRFLIRHDNSLQQPPRHEAAAAAGDKASEDVEHSEMHRLEQRPGCVGASRSTRGTSACMPGGGGDTYLVSALRGPGGEE